MMSLMNLFRRARSRYRQFVGADLRHRLQVRLPRTELLGKLDADWCIRPDGLAPGSILYSFGVGMDVSFDLAMIERFGLTVHAFDPTPRSIEWVAGQKLPEQFVFHPYGLAAEDGELKMFAPEDPKHVSYSILPEPGQAGEAISMPVYQLDTIAEMLGHDKVDIVKIDVEGAEYEIIDRLAELRTDVTQLLIEFHHIHKKGVSKQATARAIRQLNDLGYRVFYISVSGAEYSFLRGEATP